MARASTSRGAGRSTGVARGERVGACRSLVREQCVSRRPVELSRSHSFQPPADAGVGAAGRVHLAPADAGVAPAGGIELPPADARGAAARRADVTAADARFRAAGHVADATADAGVRTDEDVLG